MKENIIVHVLNFNQGEHDHLECVLEMSRFNQPVYYMINQWDKADDSFFQTIHVFGEETDITGQAYITRARESLSLTIHVDFDVLKKEWKAYQDKTTQRCIQSIKYNCADGVIWFLNRFADMPKPKAFSRPVTFDRAWRRLFCPSFFQCISLPNQVMGHIERWLNTRKNLCQTKI